MYLIIKKINDWQYLYLVKNSRNNPAKRPSHKTIKCIGRIEKYSKQEISKMKELAKNKDPELLDYIEKTKQKNKDKKVERRKRRKKGDIEKRRIKDKCIICGFNTVTHKHHLIPVLKGGTSGKNNLICLCPNHHEMLHKNLISEEEINNYIKNGQSKMFIIKKTRNGKEYYYLRESIREDGKVKAKTLAYLGKSKEEAEEKAKEYKLKMEKENMPEEKQTKKPRSKPEEKSKFASFIIDSGLIWGPEPEIYGGLAGFYTYGPLGKLLKNKVENSVRKIFNSNGLREMEGPTVVPDNVWEASGHLETFKDRTIKCSKCAAVFRADKIIEEKFDVAADAWSDKKMLDFIKEKELTCPSCQGLFENKIDTQSLMMKTKVAGTDASLRPETATVTYLPYPRFYNYFKRKLPMGVFQIGKAYRNEISPRQHVLRGREFTQAEGQLFVDPKEKNNWERYEEIKEIKLPFWDYKDQENETPVKSMSIEDALKNKLIKSQAYGWCINLAYQLYIGFGIPKDRIRLRQHHPDEKAFYADDAWDIEINLNQYGWTEMCGVHDRTDYDLTQHSKFSGQKLEATRENGEKFTPHVLEIAFGTDRPTYALIDLFYEEKEEQEGKTTFKIPYSMAPIDVSVFPLMKKPELLSTAKKIKEDLEKDFIVDYNITGSIGKRYLRSATAGTPYAITVDYDSLENNDVTIRDRDTEEQKRIPIENVKDTLRKLINQELEFSNL